MSLNPDFNFDPGESDGITLPGEQWTTLSIVEDEDVNGQPMRVIIQIPTTNSPVTPPGNPGTPTPPSLPVEPPQEPTGPLPVPPILLPPDNGTPEPPDEWPDAVQIVPLTVGGINILTKVMA